MIPYVFVFAFSLLLFFILEYSLYRSSKISKINIISLITPVAVFNLLFSGTIGSDLPHYTNQYQYANDFILEPSFSLLMIFTKTLGFDYLLFSKFLAIIHLVLLFFILTNIKDSLLFFIIYLSLFYLNFHFNAIRNSLALLLIGAIYVRTNKFTISTLFVTSTIHYSSVITFLIQKNSLYFNSKMRILLFIIIILFTTYFFNDLELIINEYFYYSAYLNRVEVTKSIYPALLLKTLLVWILYKNGCSIYYLIAYAVLVGIVHFVTPDANRLCDIVLFLSVIETLSSNMMIKFRSTAIVICVLLVFSSLLIPFNDCNDNSIDNWCIN